MSRRWAEDDARPPLDLRLVLPAAALWAGGLSAIVVPQLLLPIVAATAIIAVAAAAAVRHRGRSTTAVWVLGACVVCGLLATAAHLASARADPLQRAAAEQTWVEVQARVDADPVSQESGKAAPAKADADAGLWRLPATAVAVDAGDGPEPSGAGLTVFATGRAWGSVRAGETVLVRGIAQPDTFGRLPAVVIRARGAPEPVARPPAWARIADGARDRLAASAGRLNGDAAGLLRGVVVGDTRGIGPQLRADAKTTGLTHLVAVSGSHLAVVAGLVLLLLRRFGPRISGVGVTAAFAVLVVVVGLGPSVLRAVAMGAIGVVGTAAGRPRSAFSALAATVLVVLIARPFWVVSVGFALSVLATAGLILLAPVIDAALRRRGVPPGWAMVIALPVAAHLVTMPVIAAVSGQVSLVAVPANIAVAPVVTPALLLGLACLIVGVMWPAAGGLLARIDEPLLSWIASVAHHLARWPWASVPVPAGIIGMAAVAAAVVVGLAIARLRLGRIAVVAITVGVATTLIAARVIGVGWPLTGWLVTMCDVGQGDATVLATDEPGTAVVVDTGPEPSAVDGCLDRLHIGTIALLVLTHLHADHVGGLHGALDGRQVRAIGIGPDRSSPAAMADIRGAAEVGGIPVVELRRGDRWQQVGLSLTVLGPVREFHGTDSDPNNDSLVIRAERGGATVLLAGDVERPAQQALLDSDTDLRADILKQPHHGSSKLLAGFVAAVSARVALIGVGADNDYGHPSATALDLDRRAGIGTILRTDRDGDIEIRATARGLESAVRGGGESPPG